MIYSIICIVYHSYHNILLHHSHNIHCTMPTPTVPQMIESERLQVKELRAEGFSDRQLQEMGYLSASIDRAPAVAMKQ